MRSVPRSVTVTAAMIVRLVAGLVVRLRRSVTDFVIDLVRRKSLVRLTALACSEGLLDGQ